MTLTYHVYDPFYYKVMTIVICDMQFEDTKVQCIMWWKLNKVMVRNCVPNLKTLGDSWLTSLKPIGMQFELSMVVEIQVTQRLINNELVFSLKSRILGQTHKTTNQVRDARTTQDIMLGIQECHFFGRRKC